MSRLAPSPRITLALALAATLSTPVLGGTPITLRESVAGPVDFTGTAATLRAQANGGDPCAVLPFASATLNGIPSGATVRRAWLSWAGSTAAAPDYDVTFEGSSISADRAYTETFTFGGTDYEFFNGVADVTSIVALTGNGSYTLADLTVNTGAPHCGPGAVLAGWALYVVYEHPSEPLRVVNLFEGFQQYRGSAITLTPSNFRVPAAPIDGRYAHLSWEGDETNSGTLGGFGERVAFDGVTLTDVLNPAGNQFNSTNGLVTPVDSTTWGVDFDVYDVSALLSPGQTSATTVFESGTDLVLLSAELVAVTNEPVADLSLTKSHAADLVVGTPGEYLLRVDNLGPDDDPGPIAVRDTLPAGLSLDGWSGGGWTCVAAGSIVDCTHPGPLPASTSLPGLTLTVLADPSTATTVTNVATVSGTRFDNDAGNDTASDPTAVLRADLSTSTKGVLDLDGGAVEPGDVLRYTIDVIESGGAAVVGASVTDEIPANVIGFTVVSIPPGATDSSSPTGGANGTGRLVVDGVGVAAGGQATIVFEVTVDPAAADGASIPNSAVVSNPAGSDATPAAPTLTVTLPPPGNKPLYVWTRPSLDLSRTPPPTGAANEPVDRGQTKSWAMTPASAETLVLDGSTGSIRVALLLRKGGGSASSVNRTMQVALRATGGTVGPIGGPVTLAVSLTGTPQLVSFFVPVTGDVTLAPGTSIVLDVTNVTPGNNRRRVRVFPDSGGERSRVELFASTVIRVDAIDTHASAWPAVAPLGWAQPGDRIRVRAVVADPFGSFDIAGAALETLDPSGSPVGGSVAMTQVADSGAATATYEIAWDVPAGGPTGDWTLRVTADEGTEGTVRDTAAVSFTVAVGTPQLTIAKSADVATVDPGGEIRYAIDVVNTASAIASVVVVDDALGAHTALALDPFGNGSPFEFVDGAAASGLIPGTPQYSDDDGTSYGYAPVSGGGGAPTGHDGNVTHWRLPLTGSMVGSGAAFTIRYRVRVR